MKLKCPNCSTPFEAQVSPGTAVACPSCSAKLRPRAPSEPKPAAVRPTAPPKPAAPVALLDDDAEEDRPRRRKKKRRSRSGDEILSVRNGVMLLVLLCLVGAIIRLVKNFDPNKQGALLSEQQLAKERKQTPAGADIPAWLTFEPAPPPYAPPSQWPALPTPEMVEGFPRYAVQTPRRSGGATDVRVYLPKADAPPKSLTLVLVPASGRNCLCGVDLDPDSTHEHLMYVREGLAVAAFSLAGPMPGTPDEEKLLRAMMEFRKANAGMDDARNALEFALAHFPSIDPSRIFIAGFSSGGSFALVFATREPRIKGVAAHAAVVDLEEPLRDVLPFFRRVPGFKDFFAQVNPKANEERINCPVFLFHAYDDFTVSSVHSTFLEERLKKAGKDVELMTSRRGGHSQSVAEFGIPGAIRWIKSRAKSSG